jgi:hypothetical protein
MLKLHGFSSSNYFNVAKLALLEKELEFEQRRISPAWCTFRWSESSPGPC